MVDIRRRNLRKVQAQDVRFVGVWTADLPSLPWSLEDGCDQCQQPSTQRTGVHETEEGTYSAHLSQQIPVKQAQYAGLQNDLSQTHEVRVSLPKLLEREVWPEFPAEQRERPRVRQVVRRAQVGRDRGHLPARVVDRGSGFEWERGAGGDERVCVDGHGRRARGWDPRRLLLGEGLQRSV